MLGDAHQLVIRSPLGKFFMRITGSDATGARMGLFRAATRANLRLTTER
jgi:hypothetical protein